MRMNEGVGPSRAATSEMASTAFPANVHHLCQHVAAHVYLILVVNHLKTSLSSQLSLSMRNFAVQEHTTLRREFLSAQYVFRRQNISMSLYTSTSFHYSSQTPLLHLGYDDLCRLLSRLSWTSIAPARRTRTIPHRLLLRARLDYAQTPHAVTKIVALRLDPKDASQPYISM